MNNCNIHSIDRKRGDNETYNIKYKRVDNIVGDAILKNVNVIMTKPHIIILYQTYFYYIRYFLWV